MNRTHKSYEMKRSTRVASYVGILILPLLLAAAWKLTQGAPAQAITVATVASHDAMSNPRPSILIDYLVASPRDTSQHLSHAEVLTLVQRGADHTQMWANVVDKSGKKVGEINIDPD